MQQAIEEALKADPNKVYPNPLVGCVIVKNDKIKTIYPDKTANFENFI